MKKILLTFIGLSISVLIFAQSTVISDRLQFAGTNTLNASLSQGQIISYNWGSLQLASRSNAAGKHISFHTGIGAIERLRIIDNGNVGIGTSSPNQLLHLKSTYPYMKFEMDQADKYSLIEWKDPSKRTAAFGWKGNTTNKRLTFYTDNGSDFEERMVIQSDGNVGIGTTSPTSSLHILSSDSRGMKFSRSGAHDFGYEIGGTTFGLYDYTDGEYRWRTGNGHVILNESGGNVGIGTNTPGSKLEIENGNFWLDSNTNVYSVLDRPSSNRRGSLVFTTGGNSTEHLPTTGINWSLGMVDSDEGGDGSEFFIGTTTYVSSAKLWLEADGKVGIGTTNPAEKLSVDGTVLAKKVRVSIIGDDWPDYVFSPKYKLKTLTELEAYIQANQHLPEVPSAKEIEQKGQDLGDIQTTLLKKVEELTLYLIEQNKRNNEQEERLKKLEKENEKLRKLVKSQG